VATSSDVVKRWIVEMDVGGRSQRDMEYSVESALGPFVLSKSTVSELTDTLSEEYEAWRMRDLRTEPGAYLFIDTVSEP
jgi:transposase-like protein